MSNLRKLKIPLILYLRYKIEGKRKKVQDVKAYAASKAYRISRTGGKK